MATGRTTESRVIPALTKTSASAAVTGPAGTFDSTDVGRAVSGTGIPGGATFTAVASDTAATLSANATATNTAAATVAADSLTSSALGFFGWSPETGAEAVTNTVASNNAGLVPPSRITNSTTAQVSGRRTRT